MDNVFFIGCLHLLHENMARHRGFSDSWEHDEHLERMWNSVVPKRGKVFILGDLTMEKASYERLADLNGFKEVILGNHDKPQHVPELLKYVDKVAGMVDYKGWCLSHAPIHPAEVVFYRGNIHAHIHHINKLPELEVSDRYQDPGALLVTTQNRYVNVDAHLIGYKPLTFEQILEQVSK